MKKLLAKALFDRNVEKVVCFLRIRKSARDEILTIFCLKTIGFFLWFYVKIITKTEVLEGFRLARANVHFVVFFAMDY